MTERSAISVPWRLMLRRAQYQMVPIGTMVLCVALVAWLWVRNARSMTVFGDVNAVRVSIESKIEGLLVELPQPVEVFDTVRKGQVVARLDVDVVDKQLQRLQAELESLKAGKASELVIREREAQIAELRARVDARDIKSPIDGTITQIFERPGESAKLASPIMTIAADRGDFIVGYVRPNQMVRPMPGMVVTVRPHNSTSGRSFNSYVASVAPQVQVLPDRHLRDPKVAEFALPVQVALPPESDLKPGELVDIVFRPDQTK